MDIRIKSDRVEFHYRARGILKCKGKFLIMRVDDAGYFHFPGGHVEISETSEQAVIREVKEEIGIDVAAEKLVCVHERFYRKNERRFHEIVFYWLLAPKGSIEIENKTIQEAELKWVTAKEMGDLDVKPSTIKNMIINQELGKLCHFVDEEPIS
jgi:mutator protein MutT